MTYGEVYEGIHYSHNRTQALRVFRNFLRGITVLPVTRPIAQQFGVIRGDLRNRGLMIGDDDTLIAATALHHHLTLVTRNLRHFQRVPHLALYQTPRRSGFLDYQIQSRLLARTALINAVHISKKV